MPPIVEKQNTTYPKQHHEPPGSPGTPPRWSPSNKTAVGGAACSDSRVWFTVRAGSLDEIYYPDVDQANTRSVRFLVTDGDEYFSDESGAVDHRVEYIEEGVPAYRITCTCPSGRYRLTKLVCCDPVRNAVMMRVQLDELQPAGSPLRLFLLVDPQISDEGRNNTLWVGNYKGLPMLCASNAHSYLAAVAEVGFLKATCAYHGSHDAIEELRRHKVIRKEYNFAEGNGMLCGELDWTDRKGGFIVTVALGESDSEACLNARGGLNQPFEEALGLLTRQWKAKQEMFAHIPDRSDAPLDMYRVSTLVLQTHESKNFPGAYVASLSIPWGFAKGDKDAGGYHVAWPRDLVETAIGKLAAGDHHAACASLMYLSCTQEHDGSWAQNMWLDGTRHWGAIQKDGIAMPIMLAARLREFDQLGSFDPWPMVERAASFLVATGPGTEQDRWETSPGYSPFTMACEIGAMHAAARFAEERGLDRAAAFLRETGDAWYEAIDEYLWVEDTRLGDEHGVKGYYQRIAPPDVIKDVDRRTLTSVEPNHPAGLRTRLAQELVCVDALALVRFGLRRADDPRILSTVELIDKVLCYQMPTGSGWRRYNYDGYGEHADGRSFDGSGIGRCWPLLAGERAHYELAAGRRAQAEELCRTIARQTSECGMIPEQVWDAPDIPERGLFAGRPTGSGMPLAWAHSEFVRLLCSLEKGYVWDCPEVLVKRYLEQGTRSDLQIWTEREPREWITAGHRLRLDLKQPTTVHWSTDGTTWKEASTEDSGMHVHTVTLDTKGLPAGAHIALRMEEGESDRKWKQTIKVRPASIR